MQQYRKQLSHVIRHGLALNSTAEEKIIALIRHSTAPLTMIGFFLQIYHLTQFWTFTPAHKKEIIGTIDQELSKAITAISYMNLLETIFIHFRCTEHDDPPLQQFIALIKKLFKEERDATVRAGLSLLLIRIGKLYKHQAIPSLAITDLLPALLFYDDPVSYAPILTTLIELFGEPTVIPLVIDLLLTYTRKIELIFLHTVYESAVTLITRHHQLHLTEKIKTLLELQQTFYGQKNIAELLDNFFIRLGRINYVLSTAEKSEAKYYINIKTPSQHIISRLSLLR